MESDFCVISDLLEKPFSRRSIAEKIDIVKKGRQCDEISDLTSVHKDKNGKYIRRFKVSQYSNMEWLSGSKKLQKLFCWPCLLFSRDSGSWSKSGFTNLNCFTLSANRHEKSVNHLKCFLTLNNFVRTRIDHQLNEHQRISDQLHNERVQKNRTILKRLIDVVCFLGKQELPFRGHDESDVSHNRGNYIELLELIRLYDPLLENHFKESKIFRDTSSIQNDLISSISSVITDRIKQELKQTDFIALILDETSDKINQSQLSTVLRFIDQNGQAQERFLQFTDISSDRSATALLEHVKKVLNYLNCGNKLIAQTYDGAAVMAGQINSLNIKVKEQYPTAVFVHCYSHKLNLTLQQSSTNIKECRIFFHTLSGISKYFSMSSKRTYALQNFVEKKLPSVAPTRWNFSLRLVNTIKENYGMIIMFFQHILDHSEDWDNDTIIKAQGFLFFLEKYQTRFLLKVFSEIFSFTDVLYNILQTKGLDIAYCSKKSEETIKKLEDMRNTFEVTEWEGDFESHFVKKRKVTQDVAEYKRLFVEILDNILIQMKNRFQSMGKLEFFCLLDRNKYEIYNKNFPDNSLKNLETQYGKFFDIFRLKNELSVLYCSEEFKDKAVFELIIFMKENNLHMGLKEVYKLATLIATIPTSTASAERTFSALGRIKTYCRSTQGQERLSSLALLSIEKILLSNLKILSPFYEDVMQKFLEKDRRVDFIFNCDFPSSHESIFTDFSVLKDSSVNGTNSVLQRPYHVNEFISEKTCKFESSVCSHYVSFSKEKEKYHALEKEVGKLKESVNILKEENLSHKNENSHLKNKIKYLENLLSDSKSASEDNLGYQNYNEFTMRDINNECLVKEEVTEESDDNSEFFHSKFVANHSNEPPSDDINQCTVKKEDSEENSIYENHFNYPPCDVFDGIVVKKEELDY